MAQVQEQEEWLVDTGDFLNGGKLNDVRRRGRESLIRFVKQHLEAESVETDRDVGMAAREIVDSFTEDEYCEIRVDLVDERRDSGADTDDDLAYSEHLAKKMVAEYDGDVIQ